MLSYTLYTAFLNVLIILAIPSYDYNYLKNYAIYSASYSLILACLLLATFDTSYEFFQFVFTFNLFENTFINLNLTFGLDGISLLFFVLTSFLIFLCSFFIQNEKLLKEYLFCLFLIHFLLLIIFSVLDLFYFYIFFEALLIPMFLLIGIWGSRERKVRASYLLFFYTVLGSFLMLLSIIYIYITVGTFDFASLFNFKFPFKIQLFLWISFFIAFASKIPMFPFHIWLPEAHVEAPTIGSVLLAGILLKLGVYGFLRYSLILFPEASIYFTPLVYTLSILGIIYASLNAIRQTDLKRIIAYSSIAHMNLIVLSIFSFNILGIEGAILQSISHGFVAGGLFFLVGILYDRYHTRLLLHYGGLVHVMPLYSGFFLLFTMSNIALPGTSSFIGEFLCLIGVYYNSFFSALISATSVILSGAYSLWLYNRVIFGNLKLHYTKIYKDIVLNEFLILFFLSILILLVGIYPQIILHYIHFSILVQFDFLTYAFF
jgi:NADH-quinone oxidoreductase subunit M